MAVFVTDEGDFKIFEQTKEVHVIFRNFTDGAEKKVSRLFFNSGDIYRQSSA